jgi:hypothetical protein
MLSQNHFCCNLSFGLTIKAKAYKGAGQEWARESHFMLPGMPKSVKEWTLTLPSELPLWVLKSQWIPEFSESNYRDQNSLNWKVFYIIEKLLEHRCLLWVRMTHLGFQDMSYGQKMGRESNWQFDTQPLKVKNHLDFLVWKWSATYHWKSLDKGYNFVLKPHLDRRFKKNVIGLQSCKSLNFENFKTPTWESRDKMTFGCWPCG